MRRTENRAPAVRAKAAMCRHQTVARRRNISAGSARATGQEGQTGQAGRTPAVRRRRNLAGRGGDPTEPVRAAGRRTGCNAGVAQAGMSGSAAGKAGRCSKNVMACIGCPRGRHGRRRGRRSDASEWPSESRMRENRPSGLMRGGVRRPLALCLFNPSAPPALPSNAGNHN